MDDHILRPNQTVQIDSSGLTCTVGEYLGGGGQGEVYRVEFGDKSFALKWYYPHYIQHDPQLCERLENAIRRRPPSDRFLWPEELASMPGVAGFGYVMPLREKRFCGIVDLMRRRVDPCFYSLATAGFELAHSYLQLHSMGLCYRDISFGNVFLDPDSGEVRICDNDNVDVNGTPGAIGGTPRFMAPEIVRGEAAPSTQTDLYSLAVLLFYMFILHHPLEGKREAAIHALDLPAMTKLYGSEPLFIFDPDDQSNQPVPGYHVNALEFWPIYPQFLRDRFTKAFTDGIRDPQHGRVAESIWRADMIRLRDSILYCAYCRAENFYDAHALKANGNNPGACWSCRRALILPFRIRIGRQIVILNHDARLYPHHIDRDKDYDFSEPVAEVMQHPSNPKIWGLKNLSKTRWHSTTPDGAVKEVDPGRSVTLMVGTRINFGKIEGEIRG